MSLLSRARRTIREHDLARADTRVAVALSGGPDSVALAHVVAELAAAGELRFAGVAHFNHQLRESAARDEAFCREMASALRVPIDVGSGDVAGLAARERRSIESAAHDLRYGFLEAARERLQADVVALGHTRDDQAETFLLRLIRGAGARGLASMHPRNGVFVRPLLDCTRGELTGWLEARSIPWVIDETNGDPAIPRNRVRAELLPLLARDFNPAIVGTLADAAAVARDEWTWLNEAAEEAMREVATAGADGLDIDVPALNRMSIALRRMVLWRAMSAAGAHRIGFGHVADALKLLDEGSSGLQIDAPGQTVKRLGPRLVLTSTRGVTRQPPAGEGEPNLFEYSLSIPGEVLIPEASGLVTAEEPRVGAPGGFRPAGYEAVVRRDLCGARLTVRNRRPGDKMRPVGLNGRKKLQDVFVDRKIARAERDRIPLIVDEQGRILWVAGVGIAEEFRVTDPSQPMLILRFKVLGGSA